jgi:hypothetical protein
MLERVALGVFAAGILATSAWLAGTPATAQSTPEKSARYSMSPAEGGGFVRLDTETGQMAHCNRRGEEWACREMSEPGRGLSGEVDRLRAENQKLRAEIRQMEEIIVGDKKNGRPGNEFKLPSEKDLDEAMSYAQRMYKKFREKLKEFESESRGMPL